MWQVILPFLTTLLGAGVKHWFGERMWSRVRVVARELAADPTKTDDPRQAVAEALIQVQLDRLVIEAKKVADAFVVNGSNPITKVRK